MLAGIKTKPKIKFPLLKDKVAKDYLQKKSGTVLFKAGCQFSHRYCKEDISKDIKLIYPNINMINSEADIVLEEDEFYVNLEINYYNTADSFVKNEMYFC